MKLSEINKWSQYSPVFVGIFAICYDVGYFWHLGRVTYSLFSLSEHLVFALQAVPFALMFLLFALLIAQIVWGLRNLKPKQFDRTVRLAAIVGVACVVTAGVLYIRGNYYEYLIALSGGTLLFQFFFLTHSNKIIGVTAIAVFSAILAFAFGVGISQIKMSNEFGPDSIELLSGNSEQGIFIRGGERGVLFFVQSQKKIQFFPWIRVKTLSVSAE